MIHGGLGNGKSLLAECVKAHSAAKGWLVFTLTDRSPMLDTEIAELAKIDRPFLLVIDGYPAWLDAIRVLGLHKHRNMSLLLTARSGSHDVLVERLEDSLPGRVVQELRIDSLDDSELTAVNALFEEYGLWGSMAALSRDQRKRHLEKRCRSEWQAILVDLFNAPQIEARFSELLGLLNSKGGYYDILIGVLALTVVNERVTMNLLVDIFGSRVLESGFQRDERVTEFIDFSRGEAVYRSSVAAKFVLSRVADPNVIIDTLVSITRSLDKYVIENRQYIETIRSIVQFSQLESILPNRSIVQRREATFRYYERVKNLNYFNANPQFWLQYAIAALVFEDFERADRYFDSAYALAEKSGTYDTHMIDNHYSRLLLEKAARSGSKDVGLKLFRNARKIIFEQMQKERLHYPYRVARGMGEYFDRFAGTFTEAERSEVVNAAQFIVRRIGLLPEDLQSNRYVRDCLKTMNHIVEVGTPRPDGAGTVSALV